MKTEFSLKQISFVKVCVYFTATIAAVTLLGWAFDIQVFKTLFPGQNSMKANNAIGLILLAASLYFYENPKLFLTHRPTRVLALVFAGAAFILGSLSLLQYVFDLDFGIDELFFKDDFRPAARFPPGRLAPVTALNFLLISGSVFLSLINKENFQRVCQTFIILAFLASFQALLGFTLGISFTHGFAFYTQMSIHTSILFLVLTIGYLSARKNVWLMKIVWSPTVAGKSTRLLILAAAVVPPLVNFIQIRLERTGQVNEDFATLISVMGSVVFFLVIIGKLASDLFKTEGLQAEAEHKLLEINSKLEQRVIERTEAVMKNEAKVRAILESAFDAIVGMDEGGKITEWNPRAEEIFGWRKLEVIGKKMTDLVIPPQWRLKFDQGLYQFVKTGDGPVLNRKIEMTAVRKSGQEFPVELSITPLKVEGLYIFTAFLSDITQRKEDEKKLKTLNVELEKDAGEAKQASELKTFFLANMSHEIRTPINGVIGMTNLVLDSSLSPQQREYVEIIRNSADSLLSIVNDILDLSKIESGKMELEEIDFEVSSLINDLTKSIKLAALQKGLNLKTDISPNLVLNVIGDPGRLRQILLNLIVNAIKFTNEGEVTVRAVETIASDESVTIRFEIQDTGIGISPENLAKLFQPFTQADSTTSRKFGGSGLGLSICQRLVELMDGQIGVTSTEHKGSTFWFETTFRKSQNKHAHQINQFEQDITTHKAGRILVVEDNFVNQKVARAMLEKIGHRVDTVGNGHEAIAALEQFPYDVVLMDCQMPEMDGFEATEVIRSKKHSKIPSGIPIIAMTANALSGDKERCLAAGMDDYISKPVNINSLNKILQKWLS